MDCNQKNTPIEFIQERNCVVGTKRISLKVLGGAAQGFSLERHCSAPHEPTFIHRLNYEDATTIESFIKSDPYSMELRLHYRSILNIPDCTQAIRSASPSFSSDCSSESDLLTLIRRVCSEHGAATFFYHWLKFDNKTGDLDHHELLIGGAPAWAHRYVHQHWYLSDPIIEHARHDTRPVRLSALASSRGDHWLHHESKSLGLLSNVFFPAHRRNDDTLGVLHVSSPVAPPKGEGALWESRRIFRGFANEILEWKIIREYKTLAREINLNQHEVAALQLVVRGGNARHVAEELALQERDVHQLYSAINRKMNSTHIKISANKARRYGFLNSIILDDL